MLNVTNIPAPRVPFIDERTGLMAREWYRFFLNLFTLAGNGNNPISLEEVQLGPPNQPDLTELLIQINQNIAPQYEDQSGDFLATLDTAQLMSMMARFENAEAAIQGAYLHPIVQTGTIANYNLDGSPTAGGIVYGTGPALAVSAAGTLGQVLTSAGAGTPTWATAAAGTVTSVSGTGTVNGITLTGTVTSSGSLTLGGTLSNVSLATQVTGNLPVTNLNSGTSASALTFWRGDGTWSTPAGAGTVTSVAQSFTGGLISVAGSPITTSGTLALTVAGTSGGIPYFSSASTWATSAALAAGALVQGGGAGVAPSTITTGTGVVTALGVNTGTAGAFVVNGGALGTPSSGTVTNLTGTASININGTVGATTANTGAFTSLTTTGQALIGGASIGASANAFYGANGNGINYNRNTNNAAGKYWSSGPDNGNNFVVFNQAVAGVYVTDGGTSWTALSDERFKDIIEPITNAAAKVSTLRTVIGKYKTDDVNKRRAFVIAQDVQKVFSEAVDAQNPKQLGVQYSDLIPLLIAAINELSSEIQLLKSKQ